MLSLKQVNFYLVLSCLAGACLSYYAYMVELNAEANANYVAYCDISEHMSCTKAFRSKYGKGFGLVGKYFGENSRLNQPNSLGGIFFYIALATLCIFESGPVVKLQVVLSAVSNLLSAYLAYILYFVLQDFCVVCVSTYLVNAANLTFSILRWKRMSVGRGSSSSSSSGGARAGVSPRVKTQ